jgi:hypothetical protein
MLIKLVRDVSLVKLIIKSVALNSRVVSLLNTLINLPKLRRYYILLSERFILRIPLSIIRKENKVLTTIIPFNRVPTLGININKLS